MTDEHRECERRCDDCGQWLHHSRFASRTRSQKNSFGKPTVEFDVACRACQKKRRNEKKNLDRPAYVIAGRATTQAKKAGVPKSFFMVNMNFQALVPVFRAMMTPEGLCKSCGHPFDGEPDVEIEHREPPRHPHDWARLHARNIDLMCASCNRGKSNKPYADWLDDQEAERLSNERHPTVDRAVGQLFLFDEVQP